MDKPSLDNIFANMEEVVTETIKDADRQRVLDTYKNYNGIDRVVSSLELKKEFDNLPEYTAYNTKIPMLDKMCGGFREGNVVIMSGVKKSGKTSMLQTFTMNFSEQGYNCLWLTFEVPPRELFMKFGDHLPNFAIPKIHKQSKMDWVEKRIVESIAKFQTKIVFIDHLHFLIDLNFLARGNSSLTIGNIMRELKRIAIEYEIVIFLVAHAKKGRLEANIMPDSEILRDSGLIACEADYVMIMNRRQNKEKTKFINKATLFVTDNRWNGETGYVNLSYDNNRFTEISTDYQENQSDDSEIDLNKIDF